MLLCKVGNGRGITQMCLKAKDISFRYAKHQSWIVQNLNFCVEQGTCVGLSAPSGAGKSTLAMLLAGYLTPVEGEILLNEKPLSKKGICPVQLIYQHSEQTVNPRWRLRKVLEESGQISEELLAALGIESAWLGRFPQELSGGELQRFCVARALMSGASFLICDEISTMLDAITQAQIWHVVCDEAKKRNMGIVVITHNYHLARHLCSQIYDLHKIQNTEKI